MRKEINTAEKVIEDLNKSIAKTAEKIVKECDECSKTESQTAV